MVFSMAVYRFLFVQDVSEIGGKTLRAYSTCCKDEKKSYKHEPGNAFITNCIYGRANGNCRKAVSIKNSFLS